MLYNESVEKQHGLFRIQFKLLFYNNRLVVREQGGYFFIEITIKNVKINTTIIEMYSIIFLHPLS